MVFGRDRRKSQGKKWACIENMPSMHLYVKKPAYPVNFRTEKTQEKAESNFAMDKQKRIQREEEGKKQRNGDRRTVEDL